MDCLFVKHSAFYSNRVRSKESSSSEVSHRQRRFNPPVPQENPSSLLTKLLKLDLAEKTRFSMFSEALTQPHVLIRLQTERIGLEFLSPN